MSGVMTKVAIYGFIRIVFDLVGEPAWWSSLIVLAIAGVTAVLGVLYALMQHDLKRLLAYSTVENIGIIFIGLGLALAFRASGMGLPAALAMTAALFHVLNHSIFKSLLFFGAGAVLTATGERNMEHLGGLIHRMPRTAARVPDRLRRDLGAAAAQRLRVGMADLPGHSRRPRSAAMGLALHDPDGRRAAGAFGRARRGLLRQGLWRGLPRPAADAAGRAARRRSTGSRSPPCSSSPRSASSPACCRGWSSTCSAPVVKDLVGARMPVQTFLPWASIVPIAESRSSYNGLLILLFLAVSGTLTAMFIHRYATRATRRSDIWDCGYPDPSAAAQYTSSSFAMPIRRVFGTTVFMVREKVDMPRPGEMRAARFHVKVLDPAWRYIYGPAARAVLRAAVDAQPAPVPDHPPLSDAGLRDAGAAAPGGGGMALIVQIILDLIAQAVQMLLVLAVAPLVARRHAQGQGAPAAPDRPAAVAALPRSLEAPAQGGGARPQRLVALPRRALSRVRHHLGRRRRWCRPTRPT